MMGRLLWLAVSRYLLITGAIWLGHQWLGWFLAGMLMGDVAVLLERRKAARLRAALADVLAERASIQDGVNELERQVALLFQEVTERFGAAPRTHSQPMSTRLH